MDTAIKRGAIETRARRLLAAALIVSGPVWAQDAPAPANQDEAIKRLEQLEQEVKALKKQVREDGEASKEAAKTAPKIDLGVKGLTVTSADQQHQLQIRTFVQMDAGWLFNDNGLDSKIVAPGTTPLFGRVNSGVDFRTARLILQGFVFKDFKYKFETDFAGDNGGLSPTFKDVYIEYDQIPYGGGRRMAARFGHFKQPFNLEDQTSTQDLTFMEKPLLDVFVPSRDVGLMFSDAVLGDVGKERLTWAAGVFRETDENPGPGDSNDLKGYQAALRVTGLPWYDKGGRRLIHLGFGYSHRTLDGTLDYRTRSESRLISPRYVDPQLTAIPTATPLPAGVIRLNSARPQSVDAFDAEFAGVIGPFWWQAEYIASLVDTEKRGSLNFQGYYAEAGYVITGEKRTYKNDKGVFAAPIPKKNFNPFGPSQGWGAWEIAARYSYVDMNDGPVRGGTQSAYTLGLNWYLNPNLRWSLDYNFSDMKNDFYRGDFGVLQTRFQLAF